MKLDPFTLRVALDSRGTARGELYLDDGESYSHEKGDLIWREFLASSAKGKAKAKALRISSKDLASQHPKEAVSDVALTSYNSANSFAKSMEGVKVERVTVLGLKEEPTEVKTEGGQALNWEFDAGVPAEGRKEGTASVLTVKNPGLSISLDWTIVIE